MDKKTFLNELRNRLSFLPKDELERTIAYYSEMISDRIDTGMSEAQAVAAVGSIDEIVESVRAEGNYQSTKEEDKNYKTFINIMLVIGIIALYFALVWDIIISVSFAASTVICLIAAFATAITLGMPAFMIFAGISLILTAFFLITIPISSYIRFGIRRIKECIRR
ncbi:MAG: DUF1700 domain-containing protein [Clostridia bacterium]|nr:DUF1700 domain-containing protein [Clostridia bacterium]